MNELTTNHNTEWITAPNDTMLTFVSAVLVSDRNYAYREQYHAIHAAAKLDAWDKALAFSTRLRDFAIASRDRDGESTAHLLVAFVLIALQQYEDAQRELSRVHVHGFSIVSVWQGALARTAYAIAAHALGDTVSAITALQQALDYCDTIAEKTTQDNAYIGLCTASRKARQRIAHDPDHKRTRETLRVALREAIARLAGQA